MAPTPEPQQTDAELRLVLEMASDAVVSMDAAGRITRWNPAAERTFGRPAADVIGRTVAEILVPGHLRSHHQEGLRHFLKTGEGPVIGRRIEVPARHFDGHDIPVEVTIAAVQLGEEWRFTAFIEDISDRRREERFRQAGLEVSRALAADPPVGEAVGMVLREVGTQLSWTVGAWWEIDDGGETMSCRQLWHAEGLQTPEFDRACAGRRFRPGEGLPGRAWEGREVTWIDDVVVDPNFPRAPAALADGLHGGIALPIQSGGQIAGIIEFFSGFVRPPDFPLREMLETISAQLGPYLQARRARDELEARAGALERSNRELEQFAYVASHDLAEPLRTIAGFAQLLSRRYEGQLDEQADEFIGFIIAGVDRLQSLIDDLLTYSRVSGAEEVREPVALGDVAQEVIEALAATIAERDAQVEISELPTVEANAREMRQLLQNVVANALKFVASDRRPEVAVTARRADRGWRVDVRDNGIGIDPTQAERIFGMFQRLHGRGEYEGTGIGLALARRIVERRRGELWVEPAEGGGSVFSFTLPD